MNLAMYSGGAFTLWTVCNPDGTFNRQYKSTEAELAAFIADGSKPPPGMTAQEWLNPGSRFMGHCPAVGEIIVGDDGSLIIKYAEQQDAVTGKLSVQRIQIAPIEFTGKPPAITVLPSVFANAKDIKGNPKPVPITDITAGVMTLTSQVQVG